MALCPVAGAREVREPLDPKSKPPRAACPDVYDQESTGRSSSASTVRLRSTVPAFITMSIKSDSSIKG
jgi:hypothetical protein